MQKVMDMGRAQLGYIIGEKAEAVKDKYDWTGVRPVVDIYGQVWDIVDEHDNSLLGHPRQGLVHMGWIAVTAATREDIVCARIIEVLIRAEEPMSADQIIAEINQV